MPGEADGDGDRVFWTWSFTRAFMVESIGIPFEGTILWADFPATAAVGADTSALGDPVFEDGDGNAINGVTLSVAHQSGDCAWNDATNIISFNGTSECVLEVSARGMRGQREQSALFRVTPDIGGFTLAWTGYGSGGNSATYGAVPLRWWMPRRQPRC